MKFKFLIYFAILGVVFASCNSKNKEKNSHVVTQRYIHKYGYDVSKDEWGSNTYPGQVVTSLKNGVTISSQYEDGVLHGQTTYSYPHSQTLESLHVYERGNLVKKISYDIKGIPQKEETYLSPTHVQSKSWYLSGTPMCVEEWIDTTLIHGEYFTLQNEAESKVENGYGVKTYRTKNGDLQCRETFEEGKVIESVTFHDNNVPSTSVTFKEGKPHGERKVYGPTGDPISVENFTMGILNGPSTYFQNGVKFRESNFKQGLREGIERQYVDGELLVEETEYHDGVKHGPSTFYCDGFSKTEWYYNNEQVSKAKFEELTEREKVISIMNERAKSKKIQEDLLELQEEIQ